MSETGSLFPTLREVVITVDLKSARTPIDCNSNGPILLLGYEEDVIKAFISRT